jgi:Uma2 family endonuclease
MSAVLQIKRLTEQDYLTLEATSEFKNEYVDGDCYAMSGASDQHNRITGNIFFRLRLAMQGKPNPCAVYSSDMKCRTEHGKIYYYPDVMLVCDKDDNAQFYKERPCFIAEVQSPSTERVDRHEKWQTYSEIPSLRYYLLADSQRKKVEFYQRGANGAWQLGSLTAGETLQINCGGYQAALTLDYIYEDVVFE